jgi:Zn-dependent M28 family amino/carboxypeptidase
MRSLLVFFTTALSFAQQAPSNLRTGYDSIQASRLKADLTFVSSDALEGRRSLQRGSEVAIQWIASEFAKAGLKPAAGDSYLQRVPLIESTPDRELTTLSVTRAGNTETFRAPDVNSTYAHETSGSGGVVFAGFGITAPELNYDDYAGINAKGKVVLIFNHEPGEADANSAFNGTGNTRYNNNVYKLFNAQKHGAIALVTMPDPNHHGPVRTPGASAPSSSPAETARTQQAAAMRPRIPPEAIAEGGPEIPLFIMSERAGNSLFQAAGKQAADVSKSIDSKAAPASFDIPGVEVGFRTVLSEVRRSDSYNVAGLLEGSDPALKAETVIFSAHFDHDGTGPAGIYHGADDNGSGTVGVVALAHAFAANPVKPKRSLLFIVFAAEERGLLGAYYYVSHPLRPLATTRATLNFDMIGRNEAADPRVITEISPDTSNQLGLIGTHYSPDYRETVERENNIVGLDLTYKWDRDSYNGILFRSDQYPFLMHDIPGVWWFTGFHPDYHQITDTVEKINFEKMTKILRLAYLSGFEFANESSGPKLKAQAKSF